MFSELVDLVVHEAGRPDELSAIVYAMNETCREISSQDNWPSDMAELLLDVTDSPQPVVWKPPDALVRVRHMGYVEYDGHCEPTRVAPSRRLLKLSKYYYQVGQEYVFVGAASYIKLAYYVYPRWLVYYPKGQRPSEYIGETGEWTDPSKIDLVSNWIIARHGHAVKAGTLAKLYAAKNDPRQQVQYAQLSKAIADLIRGEGISEQLGSRHG